MVAGGVVPAGCPEAPQAMAARPAVATAAAMASVLIWLRIMIVFSLSRGPCCLLARGRACGRRSHAERDSALCGRGVAASVAEVTLGLKSRSPRLARAPGLDGAFRRPATTS